MKKIVFPLLCLFIIGCIPPTVPPPEPTEGLDFEPLPEEEEAEEETEEETQEGILTFSHEGEVSGIISWEIYINDVYFTTLSDNQQQSTLLEVGVYDIYIIRRFSAPGFKTNVMEINDTVTLTTAGWTYYLN